MLQLKCGRLDGSWITGTERKHFHIFFPFYASITTQHFAVDITKRFPVLYFVNDLMSFCLHP